MEDKDGKRSHLLFKIICAANIIALIVAVIVILIIRFKGSLGLSQQQREDITLAVSIINPVLAVITIFITLLLHASDSEQNNQILKELKKSVKINRAYCDMQRQSLDSMTAAKANLLQSTFSLNTITFLDNLKYKELTFINVSEGANSRKQIVMILAFKVECANEIKELYLTKFILNRKAHSKNGLLDIVSENGLNVSLTPHIEEKNRFLIEVYTNVNDSAFEDLIMKLDKERKPNNKSASTLDLNLEFNFKTYDNQSGSWIANSRAELDVNDTSKNKFTFIKTRDLKKPLQ